MMLLQSLLLIESSSSHLQDTRSTLQVCHKQHLNKSAITSHLKPLAKTKRRQTWTMKSRRKEPASVIVNLCPKSRSQIQNTTRTFYAIPRIMHLQTIIECHKLRGSHEILGETLNLCKRDGHELQCTSCSHKMHKPHEKKPDLHAEGEHGQEESWLRHEHDDFCHVQTFCRQHYYTIQYYKTGHLPRKTKSKAASLCEERSPGTIYWGQW